MVNVVSLKNIIPFTLLFNLMTLTSFALDNSPEISTIDEAEEALEIISKKIISSPKKAELYVTRGDIYFLLHEFESAEEDYNMAIELDENLDAAYYGRGMALGRMGFVKEGIADLSVFISRHPESSLAYTKRGVRYIWLGDSDNAQKDLSKAVKLDSSNAEAHDDLGVVLAQKGEYAKALNHFHITINLDPSYQKAFHNLAMAYFITGNDNEALLYVNHSLRLAPEYRDSLLLKSKILEAMGEFEQAKEIKEDAAFVPASDDWSEHAPVQ